MSRLWRPLCSIVPQCSARVGILSGLWGGLQQPVDRRGFPLGTAWFPPIILLPTIFISQVF